MSKRMIRSLYILTVVVLVTGCATSGGPTAGGGKSVVEFVNPEMYTDFQLPDSTPKQSCAILLPDLEQFIQQQTTRYVPASETLTLRILNIDQAGMIRVGAGGSIRVTTANSLARISFEYKLTDASGAVLKSGREDLSDLPDDFDAYYADDTRLVVIKRLLGNWISRVAKR